MNNLYCVLMIFVQFFFFLETGLLFHFNLLSFHIIFIIFFTCCDADMYVFNETKPEKETMNGIQKKKKRELNNLMANFVHDSLHAITNTSLLSHKMDTVQ